MRWNVRQDFTNLFYLTFWVLGLLDLTIKEKYIFLEWLILHIFPSLHNFATSLGEDGCILLLIWKAQEMENKLATYKSNFVIDVEWIYPSL